MKRFKSKKVYSKNTMSKVIFIVFFCIFINSLFLLQIYAHQISGKSILVISEKLDKILYNFLNELITEDIINAENVSNLLEVTKNKEGEILAVYYDMEKSYSILSEVANILNDSINALENGQIKVESNDTYLIDNSFSKGKGLIFNVPLFLGSNNIFLNNIGPRIPILINFNETLLTNIKTKITNYGLNNALLEIYVTVEMNKLIMTPVSKDNNKFQYDILISSLVINGRVPEFYGSEILTNSNILDIPNKSNL